MPEGGLGNALGGTLRAGHFPQGLVRNEDVGADLGESVHLYDVVRAHADAAVAGGLAQRAFLGGAVDVDAALEGIPGVAEEAFDPDDAGDDGIAVLGVWREDFAGGEAVFDDGALGQPAADAVVNPEGAEGGLVAVRLVADAEPGGGDGIFSDELAAIRRRRCAGPLRR